LHVSDIAVHLILGLSSPVSRGRRFVAKAGAEEEPADPRTTLPFGPSPGPSRGIGIERGYYLRPTLFTGVTNDMRIAREEIFGPVLVIIGYEDDDEDEAVRIANDSVHGLAGYISGSQDRAVAIAPPDPHRQVAGSQPTGWLQFKSPARAVDPHRVDILLDEAIERFASISLDLGYPPPQAVRRPDEITHQLDLVGQQVAPLAVPSELLSFWAEWDPTSFSVLNAAGGSLHTVSGSVHHHQALQDLDRPTILLPIGRTDDTELAVELDAPDRPGSRLFRIDRDGRISLLGAGVADLLDLYSDWVDRTNETGRAPGHELHVSLHTLNRVFDDAVERFGNQHVDPNRGRWPRHWLIAEGFDEIWLEPNGATHSIIEFDTARRISWPFAATLHGAWKARTTGPAGTFGLLTDDTGSIELLNANGIPDAGQGPGDRCEMEVVGIPPASDNPEPHSTASLLLPQAFPLQVEHMAGLLREMQAAMDLLGTSVVATAIRPLG
jgi:hypothetical protein